MQSINWINIKVIFHIETVENTQQSKFGQY